jgi:hypothetical protein
MIDVYHQAILMKIIQFSNHPIISFPMKLSLDFWWLLYAVVGQAPCISLATTLTQGRPKERCHWPETYRGLLAQKNGIPGFPFWGWWPMRCNWSFHKYVWFYATSSSQSNTIKYNPRSLFLCLDRFLLSCLFQNENFERQPSPLWNGPNVWTGG